MQVPESFFFGRCAGREGRNARLLQQQCAAAGTCDAVLATKVGLDLVQGFMKLPRASAAASVNLVEAMA